MSYPFQTLDPERPAVSASISVSELRDRIARLLTVDGPRYRRLWNYYRNPLLPLTVSSDDSGSERPYRQAQEWGLPSRITGVRAGGALSLLSTQRLDDIARKEVVVENDIAWRIDTLTDYLFGKPITINSTARDPARRKQIETLLRLVLAQAGGIVFLQQLALIGSVYGFVDVLVKFDASETPHRDGAGPSPREPSAKEVVQADAPVPPHAEPAPREDDLSEPGDALLARLARCVRLEIVEPARALPLLDPNDCRSLLAYAQVYYVKRGADARASLARIKSRWFDRLFGTAQPEHNGNGFMSKHDDEIVVAEVITPDAWRRYEDEKVVASGGNSLGEIPLVHIQNTALPFEYAGASDVEPLLALQDELNTRLSDRAHRIAMQSFKMYLGKGIENFGELPVAPGRMWMTDNENASVTEFGGDSESPSEREHITEVREAMDKISSVTPIAAGAIKGRIGRLTSAAALRVTLLALLAKTERKRTTYGGGIARMCELSLAWLDRAGLFHTTPDERQIELSWPSPLPDSEQERLAVAELKLRVGVPSEVVMRELGY